MLMDAGGGGFSRGLQNTSPPSRVSQYLRQGSMWHIYRKIPLRKPTASTLSGMTSCAASHSACATNEISEHLYVGTAWNP